MDTIDAIEKAGGAATIMKASANAGMSLSKQQVFGWKMRNKLPVSEWTGETSVALVICNLIKAMGNGEVHPLDLCPGAGQYMEQQEKEAS